ncbi:MAG TPA: phosphoglycerate kinase [Candidatus Omnitrophota bacterium]|nr:phosphoglycerate kinase [Candidatus Omnitrophota bacterium]HPD84065.1 phosphoglycerate kinase [Candidatus Omnitrophota bacterium]HRZ02922.1 phosphoglycerate kinase [Candidatus Omnitrophota bacterium]
MNKMMLKDANFSGKKVIVRADFNVPLDKSLKITDDRRIRESLPTINYLLKNGAAKIILMSHLGRPDAQVVENLRLRPVAKRLEELLSQKVLALDDCIGDAVKQKIAGSPEKIILLENLRFHKEEEKNDPKFAQELSSLADIYVNDAFGTAHRAHASTAGIAKYLPAVAGFLLEKEINYLGKAVSNPQKPFVVILGGAKVSDKILLIENMLPKTDCIIIGGGMAYTFLKAQGIAIGNSKLEADKLDVAKSLLEKAKAKNVKIALPVDHVITKSIDSTDDVKTVTDIPDGYIAVDVGPVTCKNFKGILSTAKTIVWNGPLGIFEKDAFAQGTKDVAQYIGNLKGVISIIGGGDTAAAMAKFKIEDKMTHISTGGGASLEYLEGKELPGIAVLQDKK